jgi:hypothetical protein
MADTKPRPETSQPFVASRAWTCVPGLGGDLVRVGEGTNGGHDRGASSWMDGMEPNDFAVRLSHFGYHHTTSLLVWSQHHRAGDSKSVTLLSKEEEEKLLYTGGQCCFATAWECDLISRGKQTGARYS